jgi:hypothetical protein
LPLAATNVLHRWPSSEGFSATRSASDSTATRAGLREGISTNRNSPHHREYSWNIPSIYDFWIKTQNLCETCKIHIFCSITWNSANYLPLEREIWEEHGRPVTFTFYKTYSTSISACLFLVFLMYFEFKKLFPRVSSCKWKIINLSIHRHLFHNFL